ncbi:MAG: ribonuclease HII [Bacillota bacterium]
MESETTATKKSIKSIKEDLSNCAINAIDEMILLYENDERKGVMQALSQAKKRKEAHILELARMKHCMRYEMEYYEKGYDTIGGIDEVGRGPLAGPVVAAVVILPKDCDILGIDDSKKLSEKKRIALDLEIREKAIDFGIGVVPPTRIDEINILQATLEAMQIALSNLKAPPHALLVDALTIPNVKIPQKSIVHGDAESLSIGAASIIAKVYRDALMTEYHAKYPEYGFNSNKGYGSSSHIAAIKTVGASDIHRQTFLKNFIDEDSSADQKGAVGEALTVKQMVKMGYEILSTNYSVYGVGEIDIIAKKENFIVFTEVKYRSSNYAGAPMEAVDEKKQKRMIAVANAYIQENDVSAFDLRFDVAELLKKDGKMQFRYTENVFWIE